MENETVREEQKEKKEPERKKKKEAYGKRYGFLHLIQHLLFTATAVLIVMVLLGSYLTVDTRNGKVSYNLSAEDRSKGFEDSRMFNKLLGNSITDVICFGAIRGQMETDGEFDTKKVVDVTAFANRYEGVASEYITAKYYLDDLIKWAQNGFTYDDVYMTGEEADDFLSRTSTVTEVDFSSGNYSGGTISYLNTDLSSVTRVRDISGNQFASGEYTREDTDATVLQNRYRTVEGKNIEDYVSSWDEYYELCANLQKTAEDLKINYNEYVSYEEDYQASNTNIVYYIRKTIGDHTVVYTNMETKLTDNASLQEQLKELCGKYVYYDPLSMEYKTNTLIEEETLRYIVNGFDYSYPEDTQIMIGVRKSYDAADCFRQGKNGFSGYVPYLWQYLTAAFVCGVLYLAILFLLTVKEGVRRRDREGNAVIRLLPEDRIPTEIAFLAAAFLAVGIGTFTGYFINRFWDSFTNQQLTILSGVLAFAVSLIFSFFYFSAVRRIKAHTLWKNSLVYRLCTWIRKWILYAYDHAALLLRVLIPFLLFALVHMGLGYLIARTGGASLVLLLLIDGAVGYFLYRSALARQLILKGIGRIQEGDITHKIDESGMHGDNLVLAGAVNGIGDSVKAAVETSMKDERLKADLITNVSHDIKTPLTSIINYVDLIKRENITDEKIREYVDVLDVKSQRLKQLTDDLVEASKISSGNIVLHWEKINLTELLHQTIGEFSEKFAEKGLTPVLSGAEKNLSIEADSRRIWRVIENLFNNIFKYALPGTRVYIDLQLTENENAVKLVVLSIKNISAQPLKVNPEELTERFIRGDESRTTEGSGLGLSIAKNLTEAQNGQFEIQMDGDLFKVNLIFPLMEK